MTSPPDAVALTLAPVTLGAFRGEHLDRRPLLVGRDEAGRFDGLLSTADAERLVCTTALRTPAFRLVKDGVQMPAASYTREVPWRPGAFSGVAVPDAVAAAFTGGATIVLQALQLHWHPAALYCRGLEAALGFPVQANAYWTPAAAQGFAVHHDTHDVFVLQVQGRKRWRVHAPVLELPLKDQKWSPGLGAVGAPVIDVVLAPGDTLYLPRGWPHEAETSDAASLHVTVGLHVPTRLDALRAALDACGEDVEFRRALGADGVLPPELLERLAARLSAPEVARRARRRFVAGRAPVSDGRLSEVAALESIGAGTPVARRGTVIADLDGATLAFEGRTVAFPEVARGALAVVHGSGGAVFTAAGLPGPLDEAGRVVLVRRLVREGYLRIAS